MNPDSYNEENDTIDIHGPSLLTFGSLRKIYVIDMIALGTTIELDQMLTNVIINSRSIFVTFGAELLIPYFMKFYPNYQFLRNIERVIDARILYHKVKDYRQKSFHVIYKVLFAESTDN